MFLSPFFVQWVIQTVYIKFNVSSRNFTSGTHLFFYSKWYVCANIFQTFVYYILEYCVFYVYNPWQSFKIQKVEILNWLTLFLDFKSKVAAYMDQFLLSEHSHTYTVYSDRKWQIVPPVSIYKNVLTIVLITIHGFHHKQ